MKRYFYEYNGSEYESDDPVEVADTILSLSENDEKLRIKILELIVDKLVNEYEDDKYISNSYEEAFNHYFDEGMEKYKEMQLDI